MDKSFFFKTIFPVAILLCPSQSYSLPQGAEVASGQAEFSRPDGQNLIVQTSDKAIINYKEFNIAERESVEFIQPSSSSSVLNRIQGADPSQIFGSLKSNGRIFLVNPNGVYFGPNSSVSTGSLIVSTLDIADQDFLTDRYEFKLDPKNKNSEIVNRGMLSSPEGVIALLAPRILNEGIISTQVGKVFLGGAEKITIDFHGDGLINFVLEGEIEDAVIKNQGVIDAVGGNVMLRMNVAQRALQEIINTEGVVVATQMIEENGVITLVDDSYIAARNVEINAGPHSSLHASGIINASGETGGSVTLLADQIHLKNIEIDASGDFDGGTVLIGGDYQGSGDIHKAKLIHMDNQSTIWADSRLEGDGGKVIFWSEDKALFNGSIFARGGAFSGNGGLVETSGRNQFGTGTGYVNTLAPHGKVGNWLLDPLTINVMAGGGGTLAQAADCADVATNLVIDPATINAAPSNVTLCASSSITVTDAISMTNTNVGLVFTAINGGAVTTTLNANISTQAGSIVFNGNVVLGATVTLNTAAGGFINGSDVSFAANLNGTTMATESLTITCGTVGSANIGIGSGNSIGVTVPLAALTVTADGGVVIPTIGGASPGATNVTLNSAAGTRTLGNTINVSSFQVNGDLTLGNNLTLTTTNNIAVTGALDSDSAAARTLSMTSSAGSITLSGATGAQNSLTSISLNAATTIAMDSVGSVNAVGTNTTLGVTAPTSITLNGGIYNAQTSQTYTGPVILISPGHMTMRTATAAGVTFSSTVDSSVANAAGLSIIGASTFNGAVGNTAALGFLNCNGTSSINASPIVTTNGIQNFTNITIGQNTTFTNSGFVCTIIDTSVAGSTLTINANTGSINASGALGQLPAPAMGAITLTGHGGISLSGIGTGTPITGTLTLTSRAGFTFGIGAYQALSHSYNGSLMIAHSTVVINSTNNVTITGTVDPQNITMPLTVTSTAGSISITGAIGSKTNLASVTLNAATTIAIDSIAGGGNTAGSVTGLSLTAPTSITLNGGAYFTSGGAQTYTGPVIIGNATVLTSTNQAISFSSTVNGANALAVNPGTSTVTFNGTIGNTTPPTVLSVGSSAAGSIVINTTTCTTAGPQSFASPVTLNQTATFTSTNNPVSFSNTINGDMAGRSLTISAGTGPVSVAGAIGSTATTMSAVTITGNGGVTLTGIGTGAALTGAASITSTAGILLNQGTYQALSQTYTGNLTLGNSTTMTSTNNISVAGTIDPLTQAGQSLTIVSTAGSITLSADIASRNALSLLSLNAATTIAIDSVGRQGNVPGTFAGLSFTAPTSITLNGGTYCTQSGSQTFTGPVIIGSSTVLTSTDQNITFTSTINGANRLTIDQGTGIATFNGTIGNTTPLTSLNVGTSLTGSIVCDTTNFTTAGFQTYGSPVTLNQNFSINTTDSLVSFASTINGNAAGRTLSILAGQGSIAVVGAIGSTATAMGAVNFTGNGGILLTSIGTGAATTGNALLTSAAGILLNGGTYSALGFTFTGSVRLGANTTITSALNNNISFLGAVDSDSSLRTLSISTGGGGSMGTVSTTAPIGAISLLGSLSINSGAGTITLNGIGDSGAGSNSGFTLTTTATAGIILNSGNYNTTGGAQQFNGNVTLMGNASLISNNQAINFANPVNGSNTLTITAGTGAIAFNAAVGATTRLGAITFNSANGVTFSSTVTASSINQIASTGANLFTGAVDTDTIQGIILNGTTVTFSSTVATTNNGLVSINNSSTLTMPALTYTISGAFSQIGAGSVSTATNITTTNGLISFAAPVTLTGGITLNSSAGGGNISFENTLNGANALILTSGNGTISFNQAVGAVTPLTQITTTGRLVDQNNTVRATGAIGYTVTGSVFLAGNLTSDTNNVTITGNLVRDTVANATISSGNNTSITGAIDADSAARNLTISATGSATLGSVIGDATPLNNLSVTANVINVSDIGSGTTGIAGVTTLNSANAINFNGTTYVAQQQNYTGTSFNLSSDVPTAFTAETNSIAFTGGPINLGNNGSLLVTINNGNFTAPEVTGNGSQSMFTFVPNGTISIGKIDPLSAVYQSATSILITDTIEATSVTLIATAGNIANDVGGPFLVTATDYISMNAIGGAVGTFADPIDISTAGPAFAGATTNAYFTGVTGDNTVHCLPSNPPVELWFNGVNIGCGATPVPTPTPTPTPSPIDNLEGQVRKAFYVAGLYSFYYNLSYDVYFVRDLVNMDSIEQPQYLFYGERAI